MALTRNSEEKKRMVINFIKNNPHTTSRQIKKELKIHIERIFKEGMGEAFESAGVNSPRTFERKSKNEKRRIVTDYIQKHPISGSIEVSQNTGINITNVFKSIGEAYSLAGIEYPRTIKKKAKNRRQEIIKLINSNPTVTIPEIMQILDCNPYRFFNSTREMYLAAGIDYFSGNKKRRIKKRTIVLNFIRKNPLATQREINLACKTHIQELFNGGIKEAYSLAGINFPFERLKLHGVALRDIKNRAVAFEEDIASKLRGYGNVNRLVKTKRGIADIILERQGKKLIIEVKDYCAKDISISQIKQLNKYLEDCRCNIGVLICHEKPKKDTFLMGKNKIFILDESQLNEVPQILEGV